VAEPVVASIATLPARVHLLSRVVAAILPQVDHLNVFFDGHENVPPCLLPHLHKVTLAYAADYGALHGSGKFLWAEKSVGYHLTIDDDLLYPPNYVSQMIAAIERHQRRAVICVLGRRFLTPILKDFYQSPMLGFSADAELVVDLHVHLPGSGTVAWHTDTFKIAPSRTPFQDDMHVALTARRQNVSIIALARPTSWVMTQEVNGFTTAAMADKIPNLNRLLREHAPWPALPAPNNQLLKDLIRRHWR